MHHSFPSIVGHTCCCTGAVAADGKMALRREMLLFHICTIPGRILLPSCRHGPLRGNDGQMAVPCLNNAMSGCFTTNSKLNVDSLPCPTHSDLCSNGVRSEAQWCYGQPPVFTCMTRGLFPTANGLTSVSSCDVSATKMAIRKWVSGIHESIRWSSRMEGTSKRGHSRGEQNSKKVQTVHNSVEFSVDFFR